MNILAAIKREERKVAKQVGRLQGQLDSLRAAAKALSDSVSNEVNGVQKRVLSPAARRKISAAAKRRWAKVKAGAKKAVS